MFKKANIKAKGSIIYKAKQTPSGVVVVRRKEHDEWHDSLDIHYNGEAIEVELKQDLMCFLPKPLSLDKVEEITDITLTSECLLEILVDEIYKPREVKNYCKKKGSPLDRDWETHKILF